VPKPLLYAALAVALVLSAVAFLTLSPVLAAAVLIGSLTIAAVLGLAADWDEHPNFEERERVRSRRRQEKWERTAGARAKDRARWEAYQSKKAAREQGSSSS
jgi:hypothetical protein